MDLAIVGAGIGGPSWHCGCTRRSCRAACTTTAESVFFHRFGQFIYREPSGRAATATRSTPSTGGGCTPSSSAPYATGSARTPSRWTTAAPA
jgi:hypothetical protein